MVIVAIYGGKCNFLVRLILGMHGIIGSFSRVYGAWIDAVTKFHWKQPIIA